MAKPPASVLEGLESPTIARSFVDRFLGLGGWARGKRPIIFPRCSAFHSFWPTFGFEYRFFDTQGRLLRVGYAKRFRFYFCPRAFWLVEIPRLPLNAGEDGAEPSCQLRSMRGIGAIELLLSLPILILMGMLVAQLTVLAQARLTLEHAANEAARQASNSAGTARSIDEGLARGLAPILLASSSVNDSFRASEAPRLFLMAQQAYWSERLSGRLRWDVVSPTAVGFDDWGGAERAIRPPNQTDWTRIMPRSGSEIGRDGLVRGVSSRQTYLDAATLKITVSMAVPLKFPVIGSVLAKTVAVFAGCSGGIGWSVLGGPNDSRFENAPFGYRAWYCNALLHPDQPGFPLQASASRLADSTLRHSTLGK